MCENRRYLCMNWVYHRVAKFPFLSLWQFPRQEWRDLQAHDRTRDISTFRVLGYKPAHVAGIFLRQNLVISAAGLALAYPIGYVMTRVLVRFYDTELFRMPVVITSSAIVGTGVTALVFVLITQWFVYRQVRKLDWVEGLKVNE